MDKSQVRAVSAGRLRGAVTGAVARFLGIPYAAGPFGPNRLMPPRPVRPWPGERDATRFGPTAPKGPYPEVLRAILPEVDIPGEQYLNLNVWAPADARPGARLPVFLWIHGGSFTNGSGSVADYDGNRFAADGVVCVTINYRLGAEGFLALPDGTPNRGLLDIVAALRWVRDEIETFGGDPAKVTVGGQSAGAMAICALLAMPAAAGLFRAAVLQSGAGLHTIGPQSARLVAERVGELLGAPPTRSSLAELAPQRLVEVARTVANAMPRSDVATWGELAVKRLPFSPFVDGEVLPAMPLDAIAAGASADVRLLLCTTRAEWRLFVVPSGLIETTDDAALAATAARIGLASDGLTAYRKRRTGASPGEVLSAVLTDFVYRLPALRLAEARPAGAAPTWLARFDGVDIAANGGLGSCHASDIPFVFGTADRPEMRPRLGADPSPAVTEVVHGAWVRFVRDGDPGWPAADRTGRPTALLAHGIEVVSDPDAADRYLWS
jgi:para-nitrobenzyl esterase